MCANMCGKGAQVDSTAAQATGEEEAAVSWRRRHGLGCGSAPRQKAEQADPSQPLGELGRKSPRDTAQT